MKTKIEKLTSEQQARFPEFIRRWTDIGLDTRPANRPEAERGVRLAYTLAGLPPPDRIVWCDSPLSQGLTRAIVFGLDKADISVRDSVWNSVRDSVWNSVRDPVGDSVGNSVWDSVGNPVWDPVGNSVWDPVRNSVRDSVWDPVWDPVWNPVRDPVRDSVWDSVWNSVRDSVRDPVGDPVWDPVWNPVRDPVGDSVRNSVWNSVYGQHDAAWLGYYEFFADACGLSEETQKLTGLWLVAQNAGWFLPHQKICWISERPNLLERDDRGRLHSLTGPALRYPDGWSIYSVHGVRLPEYIVERPDAITLEKIEAERNAEIRRVMVDRFGQDRYLLESGAKEIHRDDYGVLFRKEQPGDEPIVAVKVVNCTVEPDGSTRDYFLRVDPKCRTAREAVAWTFGHEAAEEYAPLIET